MAINDLPIHSFESSKKWEEWLKKHHEDETGIWIKFFKKTSGVPTISYNEALDVALCYGWIDSLLNKYDDISYIQKFTPRRAKSMWSKHNREHIERLITAKRMHPAGLRAVEAAKADGRWDAAYDKPSTMEIPNDFLKELAKDKKAEKFFNTLTKANTYAIAWRLQTAKKPETRERRMKKILQMLTKGEKIYG